MTRMLLQLAIVAASKATQRAFEAARAGGYLEAAAHLRIAGVEIQNALVLITVKHAATEAS